MTFWILSAVAIPLCVLLLVPGRATRPLLWPVLPLLPLPALGLALMGPGNWQLELPGLLLGASWQLDELRQPFLLLTALLWSFAGLFASGYITTRRTSFALYWGLTLSGNLGLVLAGDLVSFYTFFALMTFAGYGLVVHERKPDAFRAGRLYLIMAVFGEMALLAGLILAAGAADSLLLADLPGAIAASADTVLIMALLLCGFGVKAGLPLLHMWLPLAHPVAPTPASAVLSGAMIKAGLLGWLLTLPLGLASYELPGTVLALTGVVASLGAALIGVCQQQAKAVLAYSSISQMGLMTLMLGIALAEPERAHWLLPLIGLYALHHGLAKGAMFLSVGISSPCASVPRGLYWLLLALPGLSLAGLPFTSGAHAKLAMKQALAPEGLSLWLAPWLSSLLSAGAVATMVLVLRFLWLQWQHTNKDGTDPRRAVGWLLTLVTSLVLFPLLAPGLPLAIESVPVDQLNALPTLLWPILLAFLLGGISLKVHLRAPRVPAGDLVAPLEVLCKRVTLPYQMQPIVYTELIRPLCSSLRRVLPWAQRFEPWMSAQSAWLLIIVSLVLLLA
jgi:formate hydrogenlyase subunit 3/multisubunit Na+/H+ antiporter MnhD subunit